MADPDVWIRAEPPPALARGQVWLETGVHGSIIWGDLLVPLNPQG